MINNDGLFYYIMFYGNISNTWPVIVPAIDHMNLSLETLAGVEVAMQYCDTQIQYHVRSVPLGI